MNEISIIAAYRRYANNYDHIFGKMFNPGRRLAIEKMNCQPGDRVIEVGVGTGLSLPFYPDQAFVVGIDLSPHMLTRARQRVFSEELRNSALVLMDAQNMTFADNSFDKVAAMHVASVVPDPKAMVSEIKRVCKPKGDIFILNHFTNGNRLIRAFETLLSPLAKVIGFKPMFPMDQFVSDNSLDVVEVIPVNAFGYWTLIHAKNE